MIAVFIARAGLQIGWRRPDILADRVVLDEEEIRGVVMSVPEVLGCHHIRTRGTFDHTFLDLHVWFAADTTLYEAHRLSHVVKDRLMEAFPQIADAIIHIEPPPARDDESRRSNSSALPATSRLPAHVVPRSPRHFSSTTFRFTFSDGVSSPLSIENSRGRIAMRLMRSNCESSRLRPSTIS